MYYYEANYFGMHFFWWVFWVLLWISLIMLIRPLSRNNWARLRQSPKEILQHRFARGDIAEEEYEKKLALLERDSVKISHRKEHIKPA